jgi:hypothetical protein
MLFADFRLSEFVPDMQSSCKSECVYGLDFSAFASCDPPGLKICLDWRELLRPARRFRGTASGSR